MTPAPNIDAPNTRRMTYLEAIVQAQIEEMTRDDRVILMGQDLAIYGDGKPLRMFGAGRVMNMPISENSYTGLGIGAAMTGLRPIVSLSIASFMYLASDQIINQAAKLHYMTGGQMKVPLVVRSTMYYNKGLAAQHSDRCYPMFMNAPGLKILAPASPSDAKGLFKSAIRDDDPVIIFEDSAMWTTREDVSLDEEFLVPIGKAAVRKEGSDVTIVAVAGAMRQALPATATLEAQGISAELIDPRTLVPLDIDTILTSVAKTGRLIVIDNAHRTCGAGSEIVACVAEKGFNSLRAPITRLGAPDIHIPFSPALEKPLFPTSDDIVAAATRFVG